MSEDNSKGITIEITEDDIKGVVGGGLDTESAIVRFAERMARKFERSPENRAFTEMFTLPRIARMLTDKANDMVSKIADEVMAKRNEETRNDRHRYNNHQNGEYIVRCLVLAEVFRRMGATEMKNRKDKLRWYPKKPQNRYHDYYCDPDECVFAIQTGKVCKGNPHNCKSLQYKRLAILKDRFKPNPASQVIVALEESYRKKKEGLVYVDTRAVGYKDEN